MQQNGAIDLQLTQAHTLYQPTLVSHFAFSHQIPFVPNIHFSANALQPRLSLSVDHRPSNRRAAAHLGLFVALAVGGCLLSVPIAAPTARQSTSTTLLAILAWGSGQCLLTVGFIQSLPLLHEAGHGTLFRTRWLNPLVGHLAGFVALIPFESWKQVHARHHRWTGWQDVDPTTASLAPRRRSPVVLAVVRFCWRYWVPLFSVIYRLANYWHLSRLFQMFPQPTRRLRLASNWMALVTGYLAFVVLVGPRALAVVFLCPLFASLVFEDLLILSQHTHIPMQLAGDKVVRPFAAVEQRRFTRSLIFPTWFARWVLLNFDAHELHHAYPQIPGYRLPEFAATAAVGSMEGRTVPWWRWLRESRRIPGDILLFQNSHATGYDL